MKAKRPSWTPFQPGQWHPDPAEHARLLALTDTDEVWVNNRDHVNLRRRQHPDIGEMVHLSIKRRDKLAVHDWRDLPRINNELVGPEVEACERYPAESRLVDTANHYHLWCLPPGRSFPFGYDRRLLMEGNDHHTRQRPFAEGTAHAEAL